MNNLLYYLFTALIWGSTWFAIKLQLNTVPSQASVVYRFTLAALILFAWCAVKKIRLRFSFSEHLFLALLGVTLFCANYAFLYEAEKHTVSGEVAILFSLVGIFNILNNRLFFGIKADRSVVVGSLLGVAGIVLAFWTDLIRVRNAPESLAGILLTLGGAYSASIGNMVSSRLQKRGLRVVPANSFGMMYGALALFLYCLVSRVHFAFEPSLVYVGSLIYLALFGSVIAFGLYLTLVGNIGADRAGYVSILFPIVALTLSIWLEGYRVTIYSLVGIACILFGNAVVLMRKQIGSRQAANQPEENAGNEKSGWSGAGGFSGWR